MIRRADRADLGAARACVEAALAPSTDTGRSPVPMLADYTSLIDRGSVHLLEEDSALLGVIVLEPLPDHMFVETLAVPPEHQRKGVGRRLMRFAESEARRYHLPELRLYTSAAMTGSLAFYRALGFEERERQTEGGHARIYLARALDPAGSPAPTAPALR